MAPGRHGDHCLNGRIPPVGGFFLAVAVVSLGIGLVRHARYIRSSASASNRLAIRTSSVAISGECSAIRRNSVAARLRKISVSFTRWISWVVGIGLPIRLDHARPLLRNYAADSPVARFSLCSG
jgi:hypothetical protein